MLYKNTESQYTQYSKVLFTITVLYGVLLAGHRVDGYLELENEKKIPIRMGNECDLRVSNDHEFETCRRRAFADWNTYDQTQRIQYDCCYQWDLIDCEEKSVYALCDRWQYDDEYKSYKQRKREHIDYFERYQCAEFAYSGANCRFPVWAIVLIVLAGVIVLVGLCAICFYVRKRSRRQKESERMDDE